MAKLVGSAATVHPSTAKLLPDLIKFKTSIGDPEARGVVGRVIATLHQIGEVPSYAKNFDVSKRDTLCNCEFSLAYGAKILLNTATLCLERASCYGLCGGGGARKSTLMRAIHNTWSLTPSPLVWPPTTSCLVFTRITILTVDDILVSCSMVQ